MKTRPVIPYKPREPSTTIKVPHRIDHIEDHSVAELLNAVPEGVNPSDIYLRKDLEWGYYDDVFAVVYLEYYTEEPNTKYDKELALYKKALDNYKLALAEYEKYLTKKVAKG